MNDLGNLLIAQGGGPTAVLNATLVGAIHEARKLGVKRILGARWGVAGLVKDDLVELTELSAEQLQLLRNSPGATLGSTRFKPEAGDIQRIRENLEKRGIAGLIVVGGNGTLKAAEAIANEHKSVRVMGAPKTIDNDIPGTDRCPGFGSAARYVA